MTDFQPIVDALASHAAALGYFEKVNQHEPKSAPVLSGLTAAIWLDRIAPATGQSGLDQTTALLVMSVRVYTSAWAQPLDAIDPNMLAAVSGLMGAYSGAFTLGGLVRNVDLLGSSGTPLAAQAGYLEQGGKVFRVMTITAPMIVNDVWGQDG